MKKLTYSYEMRTLAFAAAAAAAFRSPCSSVCVKFFTNKYLKLKPSKPTLKLKNRVYLKILSEASDDDDEAFDDEYSIMRREEK